MAWQSRSDTQHQYYVRRFYRDGRRCHEYVGRGPAGILAAEADARRWAELQAAWEAGRTERQQLSATNAPLDALDDNLEVLRKAVLFASGFRQVDRHWRPNPHAKR